MLQKKGGPICLSSTCAIAWIVMLWWDERLPSLVARNNLTLKQKARYMGDTNMWLHSVTLGWRWVNNSLRFSMVWRM